jgi:hypothetical protein
MFQPSQHLTDFFTSPLVYYILVASIIASIAYINSEAFIFEHRHADPDLVFRSTDDYFDGEGEKFNFSFSAYRGPNTFDVLEGTGSLLFGLLLLPSAIVTGIFVAFFKTAFPGLGPTAYFAATAIAYVYFNAYYWVTLAYAAESLFNEITADRKPMKVLSIFDE